MLAETLKIKKLYLSEQTWRNLQKLRADRLALGISQSELAKQTGLKNFQISSYEKVKALPRLGDYLTLANFFNWKLDDDPNYICYQMMCSGKLKSWLLKQKRRYGYKLQEICEELAISPEAVDSVFYFPVERKSLSMTCRIYELFQQEQQREIEREKILKERRK